MIGQRDRTVQRRFRVRQHDVIAALGIQHDTGTKLPDQFCRPGPRRNDDDIGFVLAGFGSHHVVAMKPRDGILHDRTATSAESFGEPLDQPPRMAQR